MSENTDATIVPSHHHSGRDHACDHHHDRPSANPDTSAMISARRVTVTRAGRDLLQQVDIDIWPGEIVTLIGPNGAGKTTLVKALLGLEALDGGTIFKRNGLVLGYVPQRFSPDVALPLTVERFLTLGICSGKTNERILAALNEVGAAHVLKTQLHQVSGGELQRVLLARALLRRPGILVLDEPAQGVDLAGEVELYELISGLAKQYDMSILLVSHDLHTVMARSNRVICLNRHVCCSGVPDTVSKHPEYGRLFGAAAAKSIAIYRHRHDHDHDLSGAPTPPAEDSGETRS